MASSKLETKVSDTRARIDRVIRLQYDVGSTHLSVYFNVSDKVGDEEFGERFDGGTPETIAIDEIQEALNTIFAKGLELRVKRIEAPSKIITTPNYRTFFDKLIQLPIFALVQQQNAIDLQINAAYTDFALVLGNCIAGAENSEALQNTLDRVLSGLGESATQELLEELQGAIDANAIPLKLVNLVEEGEQV
jgi:hypothetical protein